VNQATNLYRVTPRQAVEYILDILEAGLVPNLIGSPGIGKSYIFHKIAEQFRLKLIDHRVSTSAPEDFSGLPEFRDTPTGRRKAVFTPFSDIFPTEDMEVPEGYDGWLLFMDEINSGTKMTVAAMYKLVLDHMTALEKLHPKLLKACAGNLMTDRAIVNDLGNAMKSRLVTLELMVDFNEWLEDVALPQQFDTRIIAFNSYDNDELFNFKPDHTDLTFNCPRTWEMMHKLIKNKPVTEHKTGLYAGTISSGSAAKFVAFCALESELIKVRDILADPENAPIPRENDRKWMLISHLMGHANEKNLNELCKYVDRIDLTFKIVFFRGLMVRNPEFRTHPSFVAAMIAINKKLGKK
jgi:hypothetical protein